jgi:mannose-6-phosphate isomerase-like protein (cupin superfamily)
MTKIREFATTWGSPAPRMWFEREKEELIGSAAGAPEDLPNFRPFDMLDEPNQSLLVLQNEDMRVGVENVTGTQPYFRRNSDYDTLYFQFAGTARIETEYGVFEQKCGDLLLVPKGIAQRSTGSADCLRLYAFLHEPVEPLYTAEKHQSHTEFEMVRTGGPSWGAANGRLAEPPSGQVVERMYLWDEPEPSIVQRTTGYLIGKATEGRGVTHYRPFDVFHEMTGKRGPGPMLMKSSVFFCEVYNTEGEQFAFHRALDSVEAWLQFRGDSINESEYGSVHLLPGEMNYAPVGVPHRVVGGEGFLRFVLYSKRPWQVLVNASMHRYESRYEAQTRELERAAWRDAPVGAGA